MHRSMCTATAEPSVVRYQFEFPVKRNYALKLNWKLRQIAVD